MNKQPYFSVIVPCWNCKKTIKRVLDSIVKQLNEIDKDDIEVILMDDGHEDNWPEEIEEYKDKLNIIYDQTKPHKIHCPGNTRRDALPLATGQWILFCDNDDFFQVGSFYKIKKEIETTNEKNVLATYAIELDIDTYIGHFLDECITILHGKVYNRQFLIENNINFKEDLETHEDLYFNTKVIGFLLKMGFEDFHWAEISSYVWVMRKDSITRSFWSKPEEKNYLELHLQDYLSAYVDSYISLWKDSLKNNEILKTHIMCSILYAYFYYQGEIFRLGEEMSQSEYEIVKNHIYKIINECDITKNDILKYIKENAPIYHLIREEIPKTEGDFVETISFPDFIKQI